MMHRFMLVFELIVHPGEWPLYFVSAVWLFLLFIHHFPKKKIMCDDITSEDLHLASVAGFDDILCDDLNQECVR